MKYFSKRNLYKVLICLILFLSLICGWTFYSLKQFDVFVYPWQLKGLSNANEYYRENISDYLLKNGSLYKVNVLKTDRQKIFDDKIFGLQFKYQEDLTIKSSTKDASDYKSHIFIDKDGKDVCSLSVSKGFMVNSPKVIEFIKYRNRKGELKYIKVDETVYWFNIGDMSTENDSRTREVFLFKDGEYRLLGFGDSCGKGFIDNTISTLNLKAGDTEFVPEYFPKDIDVSGWKVYKDEVLGFEIKTPPKWNERESDDFGGSGFRSFSETRKEDSEGVSVLKYVPANEAGKAEETDFKKRVSEIRKKGNDRVYFIRMGEETGFIERFPNLDRVVFEHGQNVWSITIKNDSKENITDGILKFFKFIN